MTEGNNLPERNYLEKLYQTLNIMSATDVNATLNIIACIEAITCGMKQPDSDEAPGSLHEIVSEFKQYQKTNDQPDLKDILELRDSLYRYQSLYS